jgi:hypothetical protein
MIEFTRYPLNRRCEENQSSVNHEGEEKNTSVPTGNQSLAIQSQTDLIMEVLKLFDFFTLSLI